MLRSAPQSSMVRALTVGLMVLAGLAVAGCQGTAPRPVARSFPTTWPSGTTLITLAAVRAQCDPPPGWKADPLKRDERHTHQVWLSPTGRTAYGVIYFSVPLPIGVSAVRWQFLREMKKQQGGATLIEDQYDPKLPGIRFVVDDPVYRTRFNLVVNGFQGWAVYAGTVRDQPIEPEELELAEKARDRTVLGLPEQAAARD